MKWQNARAFCVSVFCFTAIIPNFVYADTKAGETLAKNGASGVAPCVQCHGAQGEGQATTGFPRLAGQSQGYLVKQLQDFKGPRTDPVMQVFARSLSAQQISDVSEYYASLPPWQRNKPALPLASPRTAASRGAQLAQKGNWDSGVPACFACHGVQGAGIAPTFPALAGQHASYTTKQLNAWQTRTRSNDPQGLMKAVAEKLSPEDITAVSTYLEKMQ